MRIILWLLVALINCQDISVIPFRYKEGSLSIGKQVVKTAGSVYENTDKATSRISLQYVGMDYSTMTPFFVLAENKTTVSDGIEFKCTIGSWDRDIGTKITGTVKLTGTPDNFTLTGKCITEKNVVWSFSSINIKSKTPFYEPKEAGMRAKNLLGYGLAKFAAANVIFYALIDYAYFVNECAFFLYDIFPDAPGPEPGVIIVGKDQSHCAIADQEGTKFIHSDPWTAKVMESSIALINKYFPSGVIYKRYPKIPSHIFY